MNSIGYSKFTYTRDQITQLARTWVRNKKSVSRTMDIALSCIFTVPLIDAHNATITILRFIERIHEIDSDGEFQDVTDELGEWIVEALQSEP